MLKCKTMVYGKFPTVFLFSLSFLIIAGSGYQCSTRVIDSRVGGSIPLGRPDTAVGQGDQSDSYSGDDYYYGDDYFDPGENTEDRLPTEVTDNCRRSQLRDLGYGASANFEFDRTSLQDFLFGQSQNFSIACARLYLDMNKVTYDKVSVYKGSLALAFQTNTEIKPFPNFSSGFAPDENRYNKWDENSWDTTRNNKVKKNFKSIFEDEYSALILKIQDVRVKDRTDGEVRYLGAGTVYYKMFRIATQDDVKNTKGSCYSTGTYTSQAHTIPTVRNDRCWFIPFGPFSCRPQGSLDPKSTWTKINLNARGYKCFPRLGRFWNLDIEEAFNDSVQDID